MATWLGSRAARGRADAPNSRVLLSSRLIGSAGGMTCASVAETHHRAGFHRGWLAALSQDTPVTGRQARFSGGPQAFSLSMRPPSGQGRGFGARQGNA